MCEVMEQRYVPSQEERVDAFERVSKSHACRAYQGLDGRMSCLEDSFLRVSGRWGFRVRRVS